MTYENHDSNMGVKNIITRPLKWLVSLLLLPVKLLLNLVGQVISLVISLILFTLLVIGLLMYFGVLMPPESLPFDSIIEMFTNSSG